MFFDIQRICQNAPKILPKFSQSLPKWAQHGHLGANMAHLGRNLLPTWLQLGPCCAHLRPNVSKKVFQNRATAPQDAPRRAKTLQDTSRHRFFWFSTPPDLDFHWFFFNFVFLHYFFSFQSLQNLIPDKILCMFRTIFYWGEDGRNMGQVGSKLRLRWAMVSPSWPCWAQLERLWVHFWSILADALDMKNFFFTTKRKTYGF